jgi:hypothetical protein
VGDAPFDNDGSIAEREAEFMKGIELKGKAGFDLAAAAGDLLDHHRLEDHHLAVELAEDLDALVVAFIALVGHSGADYTIS